MIDDVAEFHNKFGVPVLVTPLVPSPERVQLREKLITEEYEELMLALGYGHWFSEMGAGWNQGGQRPDLPQVADAIADLIYVLIGTAHEFGIPLAEVWRRVHASNMAKDRGGKREDGKITKPEGWQPPDVEGALREAGWKP